jgi:hypothetical protein
MESNRKIASSIPSVGDEMLEKLSFTPHSKGIPIDAAIVQTDHMEYSQFHPSDIPGIKSNLDERFALRAESWWAINFKKLEILEN